MSSKSSSKCRSVESSSSEQLESSRVASPETETHNHETVGAHNCVIALIHCPKHDLFALTKRDVSPLKQTMFVVTIPLGPDDDKVDCLKKELKTSLENSSVAKAQREIGGYIKHCEPHLIHTLKIQIPGSKHFVTRYAYQVELTDSEICCQNTRLLSWHSLQELESKSLLIDASY